MQAHSHKKGIHIYCKFKKQSSVTNLLQLQNYVFCVIHVVKIQTFQFMKEITIGDLNERESS